MHVSLSALSGCSIEGRTPSTSASVCGGSALWADGNVAFITQEHIVHSSMMHCIAMFVNVFDASVRKFSIVPGHSTNSGWTARQFRAAKNLFFADLLFLLKLFRRTDLGGCLAVNPFGFISFPLLLHSVSTFIGSRRLYKLSLSRQDSDIIAALMQVLQWLLSQVPGQAMLGILGFKMFFCAQTLEPGYRAP